MEAFLSIIVLFIIVVYFISKSSKYVGYGRKRRFYKNKWNNQYNKQSKVERSNKMITFELLEYKNGRYVYSFAPDLDPNAKGELRYMMMGIV